MFEQLEIQSRFQNLSARKPEDVDYIQALPELDAFGVVVVDDFHVLPPEVQSALADLLKRLADQETEHSKLVIVGINRAGDSLVRHAPDLSNRIDVIKFEVEPRNKIEELIHLGEEALNIDLEAGHQVVEAARGASTSLRCSAGSSVSKVVSTSSRRRQSGSGLHSRAYALG